MSWIVIFIDTEFGASEIFHGWSSMQRMLELMQMPGFMDVLMASPTEVS